jgi:hypothetical protein
MPFYSRIDGRTKDGRRTATRLLDLKAALASSGVPKRRVDGRLLLATWNIREFGNSKQGVRAYEPLFYIAEIIDHFDLVAVQEVRDDLTLLNRLIDILGSWWKVLLTDVTEGRPGNRERMAFLYDSRKLSFGGLAGEIVLPPAPQKGGGYLAADQLARTPYMVGFRAGWFKFTICTTHILYGDSVKNDPRREREIRELANFLAARVSEPHAWARNMIMLGDFNIFAPQDTTMSAIREAGFVVPPQLEALPSNALKNKHYDQIAFIAPDIRDHLDLCQAGVFDFFESVYTLADEKLYERAMGNRYTIMKDGRPRDDGQRRRYYRDWRTYQMSDHLPMWIELETDFSHSYLTHKADLHVPPTSNEDEVITTMV